MRFVKAEMAGQIEELEMRTNQVVLVVWYRQENLVTDWFAGGVRAVAEF
jgi:hypothetical protein